VLEHSKSCKVKLWVKRIGTSSWKMGLERDIKKGTCSEMPFERYFLMLRYPKSCKVKSWVKRKDASSWKMGLE